MWLNLIYKMVHFWSYLGQMDEAFQVGGLSGSVSVTQLQCMYACVHLCICLNMHAVWCMLILYYTIPFTVYFILYRDLEDARLTNFPNITGATELQIL